MCYGADTPGTRLQAAKNLVSGWNHLFPEMIGKLPLSKRAEKSYERLAVTGEGHPAPLEGVARRH